MIHVQKEIVAMMTESVFLTDHFFYKRYYYILICSLKRNPRPLAKTSLKANNIHMCNYSITVLHTLANRRVYVFSELLLSAHHVTFCKPPLFLGDV